MKRPAVIALLVVWLAVLSPAVSAQQSPGTPEPRSTVPNPTTVTVPNPGGGLFNTGDKSVIRLPNLIRSFTGDDFVGSLFSFIVSLLALVGGVIAFGYLIYGGAKFIVSGGNPAAAEEGKKTVIGAIVGVVIVMLAYVIVEFVAQTFR